MFNIKFTLEHPLVPEFDPEIHDPDEVFALLCYRGIHYAKSVSYTHLTLPTKRIV